MTTHSLKTWPNYFEQVWQGLKTFEIRYDDRGYQKGDKVTLREWDRGWPCACKGRNHAADCAKYTGREITAKIGCVIASAPPSGGAQRGFTGYGYVVFSLCEPECWEVEKAEALPEAATPSPLDVARMAGAQ